MIAIVRTRCKRFDTIFFESSESLAAELGFVSWVCVTFWELDCADEFFTDELELLQHCRRLPNVGGVGRFYVFRIADAG